MGADRSLKYWLDFLFTPDSLHIVNLWKDLGFYQNFDPGVYRSIKTSPTMKCS